MYTILPGEWRGPAGMLQRHQIEGGGLRPEAGQMRPGARYRTSLVKFVGWGRDVMSYEHPGELATPGVSVAHVLD